MANNFLGALTEWERSIKRHVGSQTATIHGRLETDLEGYKERLEQISQPHKLEEWMNEFVEEYFVGGDSGTSFDAILKREWDRRVDDAKRYYPKYLEGTGGYVRGLGGGRSKRRESSLNTERGMTGLTEREVPGMDAGWATLWRDIRKRHTSIQGDKLTVSIGPGAAINSHSLSNYMALPGRMGRESHSGLNNLFLATEYGTGVAENVGGEEYVRREGESKDSRNDGSWWVSHARADYKGVRMKGQEGFHFLYDARSRRPRSIYEHQFKTQFPRFIAGKIRSSEMAGKVSFNGR